MTRLYKPSKGSTYRTLLALTQLYGSSWYHRVSQEEYAIDDGNGILMCVARNISSPAERWWRVQKRRTKHACIHCLVRNRRMVSMCFRRIVEDI